MTPARQAVIATYKRRMAAELFERPVRCEHCRQWVRREITHMVPTRNGRGRVECKRHQEQRQ